MLVRREPECPLVNFRNFAQASFKFASGLVLHTSIFDEHGEVMFAVLPSVPPKVINVAIKTVRARWWQRVT